LGRTEVETVYKEKRGKEDDVKKGGKRWNDRKGEEYAGQDGKDVMLAEDEEDTLKKTECKINKSIKRWKYDHLKMRSY
jgi:hypothetical protein